MSYIIQNNSYKSRPEDLVLGEKDENDIIKVVWVIERELTKEEQMKHMKEVIDYCNRFGLSVYQENPNDFRYLNVEGTVKEFSLALNIKFTNYQRDGRKFFSSSDPFIPLSWKNKTMGILGLDNYGTFQPK